MKTKIATNNPARGMLFTLFLLLASMVVAQEQRTLETVDVGTFLDIYETRTAEDRGVILDVRTPDEFSSGHIEGAENFDYYGPNFADLLDNLDKDEAYFVYCRSGSRSGSVLRMMDELGFREVYNLYGGISQNAPYLPVVR